MTQQIVTAETGEMTDEFAATLTDVAGQLAPRSQQTYRSDAAHFAKWLRDSNTDFVHLTRSDMIRYRQHLAEKYAKTTAARMLTVARRLMTEAVKRGARPDNPAADIRGFKGAGDNETPHTALTRAQAREMVDAIDRSTLMGKRDYALLMLLLRTGLRRSEVAALQLGDITQEQGHTVAVIRHGKGDKRRRAKIPVEVMRAIDDYLDSCGRREGELTTPLFVGFDKGDHPTRDPLSAKGIERAVIRVAKGIGVDLTPHGCRASFITIALEGGAKLQQVQYAAGHADPRTTERYQKRKINLDDNAVDYSRF